MVASNSRSRCKEQDIPFFRFSPKFDELIAAGETDNEKLFNMIIKTKLYLKQKAKEFDDLVNLFRAVAESSKDLDQDVAIDESKLQASHTINEEEEEEEVKEERGEEGDEKTVEGRVDKIEGLKKFMEKEWEGPSRKEDPSTLTELKESRIPKGDMPDTERTPTEEIEREIEREVPQEKPGSSLLGKEVLIEEGDPVTQLCKVNYEENQVCLLDPEEFTGNFLFNSISSALGGKKLELPKEDDSTSPVTLTSAEVTHRSTATASHAQITRNISGPHRNELNSNCSSATTELYTPYRTDTNEVDESMDEYTDYQRETLV